MYKYLFICTENIGRSQMAEGFYNKKRNGKYSISAGVVDSSNKYNGHPRNDVIQVMEEVGIDIKNHRIKQLTKEMIESVEKIVVFCDKNICPQIIINSSNVIYAKIIDPPDQDKTIDVIRTMRDKIKRIVDSLD